MKFVGKDFSPYVLGECPNLARGAIMVTAQGRQAQWLVGLAHRKVEPSAELSHLLVGRPPAKRQVDDFLLDVDKASICQPLLGDVAVKAQRAPEDIHSIQELLRPLHDVGVPRQGAIVAARIKVYLDLLNIARTWFEVPWKCQQNSSAWFCLWKLTCKLRSTVWASERCCHRASGYGPSPRSPAQDPAKVIRYLSG